MRFTVLGSQDGNGLTKLEVAKRVLQDREYTHALALRANQRFVETKSTIEPDDVICTLHFGPDEQRMYKIFEVKEDTVVIALPDMVMQEVPKSSLYDPDVCEDILWEDVDNGVRV